MRPKVALVLALALAAVSACSRQTPNRGDHSASALGPTTPQPAASGLPPSVQRYAAQIPLNGSSDFVPLGSDAVKDAIHRALRTGATQRWQDGQYSGYAVPSLTADAHGCRAVRYTIDQQPDAPPASINACDADR